MQKLEVFNFNKDWKQGDYPTQPMVEVAVMLSGGDRVSLSPQLANDTEVDVHIDRIIQELEQLRIQAKQILAKELKRTLQK
ncbi:hypothetical protein [Pelagibaculum spongiae]|uniref:Uncharacterized protein n=1 Tax=Pelagibaculum spongiae TaxID=2080658 RepID=A0A2V1H001_9GAMM|nr:hypothetical protein [Pelagibaculum spongiae]PVZ72009.1 hypothetical protein DC094_03035 [Pelagibaculum spongiae]